MDKIFTRKEALCHRCNANPIELICYECSTSNSFCRNCDTIIHSLPSKKNHKRDIANFIFLNEQQKLKKEKSSGRHIMARSLANELRNEPNLDENKFIAYNKTLDYASLNNHNHDYDRLRDKNNLNLNQASATINDKIPNIDQDGKNFIYCNSNSNHYQEQGKLNTFIEKNNSNIDYKGVSIQDENLSSYKDNCKSSSTKYTNDNFIKNYNHSMKSFQNLENPDYRYDSNTNNNKDNNANLFYENTPSMGINYSKSIKNFNKNSCNYSNKNKISSNSFSKSHLNNDISANENINQNFNNNNILNSFPLSQEEKHIKNFNSTNSQSELKNTNFVTTSSTSNYYSKEYVNELNMLHSKEKDDLVYKLNSLQGSLDRLKVSLSDQMISLQKQFEENNLNYNNKIQHLESQQKKLFEKNIWLNDQDRQKEKLIENLKTRVKKLKESYIDLQEKYEYHLSACKDDKIQQQRQFDELQIKIVQKDNEIEELKHFYNRKIEEIINLKNIEKADTAMFYPLNGNNLFISNNNTLEVFCLFIYFLN